MLTVCHLRRQALSGIVGIAFWKRIQRCANGPRRRARRLAFVGCSWATLSGRGSKRVVEGTSFSSTRVRGLHPHSPPCISPRAHLFSVGVLNGRTGISRAYGGRLSAAEIVYTLSPLSPIVPTDDGEEVMERRWLEREVVTALYEDEEPEELVREERTLLIPNR
jgi:hypothetical protein